MAGPSSKPIASFSGSIDPLIDEFDGLWMTREEPYRVVRIWATDAQRPKLAEEPPEIQAYSRYMALWTYDFRRDDGRHS